MKILRGVLLVLAVACLAVMVAKRWWDAHYYDGYDPALPLNASVKAEEDRPAYHRVAFTFDGLPGMPVPSLMALPRDSKGPFPCVIFLHGIGQEKEFLDDIAAPFTQAGFAFVSFDQYTRGDRKLKDTKRLESLLAFRRRGALTVIETRRLMDYLQTRDDIARDRIYLCGASYGAITGSTAAAFDPRIRAVVLCYGGGNLRLLFGNREAAEMIGALRKPAQWFLTWLLAPSDPVRHVAQISPRPILFQNGTHDSLIPTAAAQALYDAAKDPKQITWYDSDHVGLDVAHTWRVLTEAVDWLKNQDNAITGLDAGAKNAA